MHPIIGAPQTVLRGTRARAHVALGQTRTGAAEHGHPRAAALAQLGFRAAAVRLERPDAEGAVRAGGRRRRRRAL